MHVHHAPDARIERRLDALQIALQAQEAGMKAVVLKNHDYPTAPLAYIVNQVVPDIAVIGSICLNFQVGGLNAYAVEASAKLGAKVVWMPTFDSANDMRKKGLIEDGVTIFDKEGKLVSSVEEILDIIRNYRMVLATGHISAPEAFAVVDKAREKGILKIVVTHPMLKALGAYLNPDEQRRMVEMGAFIEHCFGITMPLEERLDPMKMVEAIRAVGAEHCIMSTDFGQDFNPAPAEGMRMMIATMLKCSLTEKEIELMVKINPARLLELD